MITVTTTTKTTNRLRTRARTAMIAAVLTLGATGLAAHGAIGEAPRTTGTARAVPAGTGAHAAAPAAEEKCTPNARASYAPGGSVEQLSKGPNVERIRKQRRLIVGTSGDVLLWGARDPLAGRLEGFDIELAREISRAIFGSPDKIEYRVINYAQRLPSISNNQLAEGQQRAPSQVDLVLHTMTINCARWQQIAFSSEYYTAGQKILVRADNPALASKKPSEVQIKDIEAQAGTRVCVAEGSTNIDNLEAYPQLFRNKVTVSDLGECLVRFQQGDADAITGDDAVLAGFAAQDPYARIVGTRFSDEPYGIGVNKTQVDLVRFVNAVLEQLRADGTWTRIYQGSMGAAFPGQPVPKPPAPVYGRR